MHPTTWKKEELAVAKALSSRRKLMKGTNEVEDVEHEELTVDCKVRRVWRIRHWFSKLSRDADKKGKEPILVFRKPYHSERYAAMRFSFFDKVTKELDIHTLVDVRRKTTRRWQIEKGFKAEAADSVPVLAFRNSEAETYVAVLDFAVLVAILKGCEII